VPAIHLLISALYMYACGLFILFVFGDLSYLYFSFFLFFVLPSLLSLLLSLTFQNMDPLRFQAGGHRRRPNLGLVCFVLMFAVCLVKDACLFSSCRFSFSLVMR